MDLKINGVMELLCKIRKRNLHIERCTKDTLEKFRMVLLFYTNATTLLVATHHIYLPGHTVTIKWIRLKRIDKHEVSLKDCLS